MESFNESPVTEQATANVAVSENEPKVNNTSDNTMTKEEQSPVTVGTEQAAGYAPVNETEEVTNNLKKADMQENSESPVTEQATANVAVSEKEEVSGKADENMTVPLENCLCGTHLSGTSITNPHLKKWDGNPLKENVVYHRNEMIGLKECTIMENRDSISRSKQWQKICRENGMAIPALYVRADIVKDLGFTPAIYQPNTKKWRTITKDLLSEYYTRIDGNGRASAHDLDLEAAFADPKYVPFDYTFVYKEFDNPEELYKQYISVNMDVKKTTRTELLSYSSCHNTGSIINNYSKFTLEGYVAKAAGYISFGRELTKADIQKVSSGQAISVDQQLVDCIGKLYDVYQIVFSGNASQKVLKGVPLARWTCDELKAADDMSAMADKIADKFKKMPPQYLTQLQDAKGAKGDRTRTTEIILIEIFKKVLNN